VTSDRHLNSYGKQRQKRVFKLSVRVCMCVLRENEDMEVVLLDDDEAEGSSVGQDRWNLFFTYVIANQLHCILLTYFTTHLV